jgi:glycerol-3-phosphate acyltransferase PlsY
VRNTALQILCCLLTGYLLGSISPSFLIGKLRGYDVRRSGSGNAGASNTVILVGKAAGFAVALLDILKAAAAWWLCAALFPELRLAGILGGVAAILGHMFPVWLRFRGGRGLACLGGVILAYDWRTMLMMLVLAILIAVLTNYVAVSTVSMSLIWPVYYGLRTAFWLGAGVLLIPAVPILLKHLENFRRIRRGEELRLSFLWKRQAELERIGYSEEE